MQLPLQLDLFLFSVCAISVNYAAAAGRRRAPETLPWCLLSWHVGPGAGSYLTGVDAS